MVLGTELEETFTDESASLSPEQIARAHHKSSELDISLGILGNPDEESETEETMSPDIICKAHDKSSELDLLMGLSKQCDDGDAQLTDCNDTCPPTFAESCTANSSNVATSLGFAEDSEAENEKFIAEIAASLEHDSDVFKGGEVTPAPDSPELSISIPVELLQQLKQGRFSLLLEPVPGGAEDAPAEFRMRTVPVQLSNSNDDEQPEAIKSSGQDAECEGSDSDSTDDGEGSSQKPKKRGVGSCHKDGTLTAYSLWTRIGTCEDIRKGNMPFKDAMKKWKAPRRRLSQWLKEYDAGLYANFPTMYTQEELKTMYRLKGGGKKVGDQGLEDRLVTYYNQLEDDLYPISSELLAYECLTTRCIPHSLCDSSWKG